MGLIVQYFFSSLALEVCPRIEFPDYPSCERLRTVSRDELTFAFVSALLLGVSVCLHHVDLLRKVLDS